MGALESTCYMLKEHGIMRNTCSLPSFLLLSMHPKIMSEKGRKVCSNVPTAQWHNFILLSLCARILNRTYPGQYLCYPPTLNVYFLGSESSPKQLELRMSVARKKRHGLAGRGRCAAGRGDSWNCSVIKLVGRDRSIGKSHVSMHYCQA